MTCNESIKYIILIFLVFILYGCSSGNSDKSSDSYISDHTVARLSVLESIPESAIENAKSDLVIAYGHTSHGSQIVDGVNGLDSFMTGKGYTPGKYSGLNLLCDMGNYSSSYGAYDLNNPSYTAWETATRIYLGSHSDVNVVIWAWCIGVTDATASDITIYLTLMNGLENDYPHIKFVYMTGHLDGTGLTGNLHLRNEQIRKYCRDNKKILFDFADIESYDPDGTYYGTKYPTDGCNYDFDGDGVTSDSGGDPAEPAGADKNWASDWQIANSGEWYSCSSSHTKPVNANMKAYAFWWLMARIAGWDN